ncbi:hypothetical protein N0M98_11915 [Paenibacillus doosanensis]|uniref:Uncharacterized protein n=1 Tax=Paenibacillus konkukensis TaxID=2020716 RepID=A0ABY4RVA9_9BACL|nr:MULTISPECIES: hypothetical protein [Paenibacillus]MCS7460850.1 hypothetical protein [Paenibacillus doosanensis]UQZ86265.1 hypothetical protein SK3146_05558 [Paenibacillus konkukensis]
MDTVNHILEEIDRRIKELQEMEDEHRRKHNTNERIHAKTRREELERLRSVILGEA